MVEPLDYEPNIPRHRNGWFWSAFIAAGCGTTLALTWAFKDAKGLAVPTLLLAGMAITGTVLHLANWTRSTAVAVFAGLIGPPAAAVLMMRLIGAFA